MVDDEDEDEEDINDMVKREKYIIGLIMDWFVKLDSDLIWIESLGWSVGYLGEAEGISATK